MGREGEGVGDTERERWSEGWMGREWEIQEERGGGRDGGMDGKREGGREGGGDKEERGEREREREGGGVTGRERGSE